MTLVPRSDAPCGAIRFGECQSMLARLAKHHTPESCSALSSLEHIGLLDSMCRSTQQHWERFRRPEDVDDWWFRPEDGAWFLEHEPGSWQRFRDSATSKCWWWNARTDEWFFEQV